jgi:hypothetical protein
MIENKQLMAAWLPKQWLEFFDLTDINELENEWQITLTEKEDQIPQVLKGKNIVQNGYLNPVEINDFPIRGKKTFLRFMRRRWKEEGQQESFFNNYEFHEQGMKATKEFGVFLKGFSREEADQLRSNWPDNGYF